MLSFAIQRWLTGDMGTPGEYMYQPIHLWSAAGVVFLFILALFLGRHLRHNPKAGRKLLVSIVLLQLFFEVVWRLIYLLVKGDSILCWWPIYPCNLGGVLIPIFALTMWRRGKQMFYLFGFVGGVLTFAYPEGIFSSDILSFPILKSILQHTGLLLIPGLEYVSGSYRPTLKDLGWVVCGCFIHIFNCEIISRLLGFTGDYMFFRSGMPFVIPGVPQFITLSVFAFLVLTILSILCDIKGFKQFVKSLKKPARTL